MEKKIVTNIRQKSSTLKEGMSLENFVAETLITIRCCGILVCSTALESSAGVMEVNVGDDSGATVCAAKIDLQELNATLSIMLRSLATYPSILRVARERIRQNVEEHHRRDEDQLHKNGELADAAAAYLTNTPLNWPFEVSGFKPSTRIRDLEKAAALIMAEIDRLQLAAALVAKNPATPKDTAHE